MRLRQLLLLIFAWLLSAGIATAAGPCHGKFPNLISDICWRCLFPVSIGPAKMTAGQQDAGPSPPMVCSCPAPPPVFIRYGVGIGFWEPARLAEIVRTPYCSPTLGTTLASLVAPSGTNTQGAGESSKEAFYHAHWFTFPLLSWIGMAFTQAACASSDSFDIAYLTELDPLWDDDELAFLINPEAVLFANPIAQAACIADTAAASVSFGVDALFWCSGSQGSVYPISGTSGHHVGGVDSSMLLTHRMIFKMHRQGLGMDTSTTGAMCQAVPQPILRKNQYKSQMLYPIPQTQTGMPFGRPSSIWASGREFPYEGEDYTYLVWRKRLCCAF